MGHVLMDHREGLVVDVELTEANGFAERAAALAMLDRHPCQQQRTVAADKGYDTADFIADCRKRGVTPHVAMNVTEQRDSAIDGRTTRHPGYLASQRLRKRIEECFGWSKDGRAMRKMKVVGKEKVAFLTTLTVGCYTMLRLAKLLAGSELVPA
jgi:IS5 family transposase